MIIIATIPLALRVLLKFFIEMHRELRTLLSGFLLLTNSGESASVS